MRIYLQHYTNILPSPIMKVGGFGYYPLRPTLHWSLLGLLPLMNSRVVNVETGVEKNTIYTFSDKPCKYAIIEPIHKLSHKIIGGVPEDLYSLDEHEPSDESLIFIPKKEINIKHTYFSGIVVYYDGLLINAVKNYCG